MDRAAALACSVRAPAAFAVVVAACGLVAAPSIARADGATGLSLEATVGGAFRTSIDVNDRDPGFDVLAAQAEVAMGPRWGALALVFGVRGRMGQVSNAAFYSTQSPGPTATTPSFPTYYEASGSLALQLALGDHVRARLGGDGGALVVVDRTAPIASGFLALSFDAVTWKASHVAAIVGVRLDVGGVVSNDDHLPRTTTSLGLGVGLRY